MKPNYPPWGGGSAGETFCLGLCLCGLCGGKRGKFRPEPNPPLPRPFGAPPRPSGSLPGVRGRFRL